jgi:hypothetical protein
VRNKESSGEGHDRREFIKVGGALTADLLVIMDEYHVEDAEVPLEGPLLQPSLTYVV